MVSSQCESIEDVLDVEKGYAEVEQRSNLVEGRYFPRFFTVLARRTENRP